MPTYKIYKRGNYLEVIDTDNDELWNIRVDSAFIERKKDDIVKYNIHDTEKSLTILSDILLDWFVDETDTPWELAAFETFRVCQLGYLPIALSCSSSPILDTNFAINDLTFTNNRIHDTDGFNLTFVNGSDFKYLQGIGARTAFAVDFIDSDTYFSIGSSLEYETTLKVKNLEANGRAIVGIAETSKGVGVFGIGETGVLAQSHNGGFGFEVASFTNTIAGYRANLGNIINKKGVHISNVFQQSYGIYIDNVREGIGAYIEDGNLSVNATLLKLEANIDTTYAIDVVHNGTDQSRYSSRITSLQRGLRITAKTEGILIDNTSGVSAGIGLNSTNSIGVAIQGTATGNNGVAIYGVVTNSNATALKADGAVLFRTTGENVIFNINDAGIVSLDVPTYATNGDAITGGLVAGNVYTDGVGNIKMVY